MLLSLPSRSVSECRVLNYTLFILLALLYSPQVSFFSSTFSYSHIKGFDRDFHHLHQSTDANMFEFAEQKIYYWLQDLEDWIEVDEILLSDSSRALHSSFPAWSSTNRKVLITFFFPLYIYFFPYSIWGIFSPLWIEPPSLPHKHIFLKKEKSGIKKNIRSCVSFACLTNNVRASTCVYGEVFAFPMAFIFFHVFLFVRDAWVGYVMHFSSLLFVPLH